MKSMFGFLINIPCLIPLTEGVIEELWIFGTPLDGKSKGEDDRKAGIFRSTTRILLIPTIRKFGHDPSM